MEDSVSILLGAGFSAPMGYPVGNDLNKFILNCKGDEFGFSTGGSLCTSIEGGKPNFGFTTSMDHEFSFCLEMIKYFNTKKDFDYEEFYDFLKDEAMSDPKVSEIAQPYLDRHSSVEGLLLNLDNVLCQVISYYLKDADGNKYYDDAPHRCGPYFPGYTGILNCIQKLGQSNTVNIHSLNHDLFFERLNISDWISGELCDGFEEMGSPYYGKLKSDGRSYHCRLQYYTGNYNKKFRLYKLHGSLDYYKYYESQGALAIPEKYIKIRYGINPAHLLKEKKNDDGTYFYERCWVNYHGDFLTGTTSKIERYKEPLLFKMLFERLRENLRAAKSLVIIGYGGKDKAVNEMIYENFDYKNRPSYIIDLYPGSKVKELSENLGAKLIQKELEQITLSDLNL